MKRNASDIACSKSRGGSNGNSFWVFGILLLQFRDDGSHEDRFAGSGRTSEEDTLVLIHYQIQDVPLFFTERYGKIALGMRSGDFFDLIHGQISSGRWLLLLTLSSKLFFLFLDSARCGIKKILPLVIRCLGDLWVKITLMIGFFLLETLRQYAFLGLFRGRNIEVILVTRRIALHGSIGHR